MEGQEEVEVVVDGVVETEDMMIMMIPLVDRHLRIISTDLLMMHLLRIGILNHGDLGFGVDWQLEV